MLPAQKRWIKTIHIAKKQCGLTDDEYRLILNSSAGVESTKELHSWAQYESVLKAFKTLGFTVKKSVKMPSDEIEKRNPDWVTARQEYYIRGLWDLASRRKDEHSLRAIIKRIGGVDDIHFLPQKHATKVILALRDITEKAGYNPDEPE